jgi:hypothetical protein
MKMNSDDLHQFFDKIATFFALSASTQLTIHVLNEIVGLIAGVLSISWFVYRFISHKMKQRKNQATAVESQVDPL